jgi:S1-C subfamily serine protease
MNYQATNQTEKYREIRNNQTAQYGAIIRLKNGDDNFFCTGFVIDGKYAITAAHCVDYLSTGEEIKIYSRNNVNTNVIARVLCFNHRNDSAIIMGDFRNFKPAPIEKDKHGFAASKGPFMTCGYPYDQKQLYCNYALPVEMQNFSVRLTGALIPGMSGGPVFDLNTNKVVGLNSAVDGPFIIVYPLVGTLGQCGIDN